MTLLQQLNDRAQGLGGYSEEQTRALVRSAADALERIDKIVELWFRPWGAAKAAEWEDLTNDKPFNPEVALELIRAASRVRQTREEET